MPTGIVIDTVLLNDGFTDSFSLFLPEDYDPKIPIPALFVFDPAARGAVGVQKFRDAAGSRGWIVIGSNVSRNGPYDINFQQANRLFSDALSRFSIHPDFIFLAGFSGGARLASTLAVLSQQIRGVIACGAAFSPNAGQMPLPGADFAFAGVVGSRDMNYQEMWKAEQWLDRIGMPHRIFFYDGVHSWPPEEQLQRAINWMIIETHPKEKLDPSFVIEAYKTDKNTADTLFASGRLVESHWEYEHLIKRYGSGFQPDEIPQRVREIEKSKAFKKQQKNAVQIREAEDLLRKQFTEQFRLELQLVPPVVNTKWWRQKLQVLKNKFDESKVAGGKSMQERIYNQLYAMPIEASEGFRRNDEIVKSLYCNELLTVLFPEVTPFWLRRAEDLARLQRPEEMIGVLEKIKESGYSKTSEILGNPLFAPYIDRPDFPFQEP